MYIYEYSKTRKHAVYTLGQTSREISNILVQETTTGVLRGRDILVCTVRIRFNFSLVYEHCSFLFKRTDFSPFSLRDEEK